MKAVYPGTFDPLTFGHLDVIRRGARLFGSITIAVAENPGKKPLFSFEERLEMAAEATKGMKGVRVKGFSGLLVDFLKEEKAGVVLRGLRETSDFPSEFQQAIVNRLLGKDIETVFVMTSPEHFYVTSSVVKEIARLGGDAKAFAPKLVVERLLSKF
ncbi:Phosphopantetheine adenylyltransferase [uncultured archaeon]|nr:Phosphopantetheine adenylyltransferase [uncultured archaeon]